MNKKEIDKFMADAKTATESVIKEVEDIKWKDVFKIFAIFFVIGALVFFGLYNNGLEGFARDGEFILLFALLCFLHSLIDKVLFKGVKTIEVLKSDSKAYSIYMFAFAVYALASAWLCK